VDARFLDALQVGSHSPFPDENGNVQMFRAIEFREST